MSLGLLVLLPISMFLVISFLMVYLSHSAQAGIWLAVILFSLISLIFMMARKRNTRDGPNFWLNLGLLCFLATTIATILGIYNMQNHTSRYWAYTGQRSYSNVLPSEPALSHIDAGTIFFSADARLDVARSAGYSSGEHIFCVAPVLGTAQQSVVHYWAAGFDCCRTSGNFTCGPVTKPEARGGLVYLWTGHFASPHLDDFRRAAKEAKRAFGLEPSPDALFLDWSDDPDQSLQAFWNDGIHFFLCSVVIYTSFSLAIGSALHCCRRGSPRTKLEDARLTY
eukprot:CAMPEP_0171207670 /NCGR_PEP_ID=MMETSP0790-20130122/27692_1 /TAXON_ID=2925 /ORGANISM="Alexandrium catenella, Strain OF101" /LENGTH=280 /DNA_ID=CAMNT_0011673241 /DNA_START=187 /DNA_END=1029 /DNA_ORIENTATION=+